MSLYFFIKGDGYFHSFNFYHLVLSVSRISITDLVSFHIDNHDLFADKDRNSAHWTGACCPRSTAPPWHV